MPAAPFTTLRATSSDGGTVAEYVPEAGMVCGSLTHHGEELLDPGKGLDAYAQRGPTMGIPLLYPWANRLERAEYEVVGQTVRLPADRTVIPVDPNGLPIHGIVPGRLRWRPRARVEQTTVTGLLEWTSEDLLELFPFPHELRIQATATTGALTVTTTIDAVADTPVPISFGYHPYLRLPGGDRDSWHIQMLPSQHLLLDPQQIPTGARACGAQRFRSRRQQLG
jgi:galactose mutarotase-like enzyme